MSHYDVKFLAWLSTDLLLSRGSKKKKAKSSGVWKGKTIAEQMGGPLYGRMKCVAKDSRIFDGLWVKKDEPLAVAAVGWESDVYVKYRGALRRARLVRAEIWNEYGSYGGHTVSYLMHIAELGEVWLHGPFEYATTREKAQAGMLSRVGERADEQHDGASLAVQTITRDAPAMAVDIGAAWTFVRYTWDAKLGCPVQHPIVTGPIVTTDGHTFRVERAWFPAGTYRSKESCEAAQKKGRDDKDEVLPVVG